MKNLKRAIAVAYWTSLLVIAAVGLMGWFTGRLNAYGVFQLAYFVPPIGLLLIISGQLDLLSSIKDGGLVNIKARAIDFIHWLLLVFIDVGAWMTGGTTIWWFISKLSLLAVIGWQIGVGIRQSWRPTESDKVFGAFAMIASVALGFCGGAARYLDKTPLGWGWRIETASLILSTLIVVWWIATDLKTIKEKASGYPRAMFIKGIVNNALITWFCLHMLVLRGGITNSESWLLNAGLSFNIIIGNLTYLAYYAAYEYHRWKQCI